MTNLELLFNWAEMKQVAGMGLWSKVKASIGALLGFRVRASLVASVYRDMEKVKC